MSSAALVIGEAGYTTPLATYEIRGAEAVPSSNLCDRRAKLLPKTASDTLSRRADSITSTSFGFLISSHKSFSGRESSNGVQIVKQDAPPRCTPSAKRFRVADSKTYPFRLCWSASYIKLFMPPATTNILRERRRLPHGRYFMKMSLRFADFFQVHVRRSSFQFVLLGYQGRATGWCFFEERLVVVVHFGLFGLIEKFQDTTLSPSAISLSSVA